MASIVSGSIALITILIRVWECFEQSQWTVADAAAFTAWVSLPSCTKLIVFSNSKENQGSSVPMNVFEFFSSCESVGFGGVDLVLTRATVMKHGMGRDIWTLTETQIINVVKVNQLPQTGHFPSLPANQSL